jgi:membrane associated rhomboid family serine protease
LKDHAAISLELQRDWQPGVRHDAAIFGSGLGLWLMLAFVARRRRSAVQQ